MLFYNNFNIIANKTVTIVKMVGFKPLTPLPSPAHVLADLKIKIETILKIKTLIE